MQLPQPSSRGRYSQGIPVLRTNRTPVRAARSLMRSRPPFSRLKVGRKMSCHERPKVLGEKCLGHGITIAIPMSRLWPFTSVIDPKQTSKSELDFLTGLDLIGIRSPVPDCSRYLIRDVRRKSRASNRAVPLRDCQPVANTFQPDLDFLALGGATHPGSLVSGYISCPPKRQGALSGARTVIDHALNDDANNLDVDVQRIERNGIERRCRIKRH